MYVLCIGGSRHIGYLSSLRLLAEGHTVTFLLRNPSAFDNNTKIQKHVQEGKAKLVKGDATVRADIQRALNEAQFEGKLDVVLFSVGGAPSFSPLKGILVNPPNLCSSSLYNLLASYPHESSSMSPQPKLIVISAYGMMTASHDTLPFLLKPLYSYGLQEPRADKLVMERAVFHAANWTWPEKEPKHTTEFLGSNWQDEMGKPGYLKNIVIIRPSFLTNGDETPAKGKYRASTEELKGACTITRKDVAHFVVENALKHWEAWNGNGVNLSY